jgi:hypothetical protein
MKPHVHYEAAFEDYLRGQGIPYIAVDESRKATIHDVPLKSFDFIVYSRSHTRWLADVKGRRWIPRSAGGRRTWENWVTLEDLEGLQQWQEVFGAGSQALLVFAYWLNGGPAPPEGLAHRFREQSYVFAGVRLEEYRVHARLRSPKWGTVHMPEQEFARFARPIADWL